MPQFQMDHEKDPKEEILQALGDISGLTLFQNQVLVAVYIRPQRTKSGLYLTDKTTDEDRYQSKVGLLVKCGPVAFQDGDGEDWFRGLHFTVNEDWLVFRPSDGWNVTVNGVLCRVLSDTAIRGRVTNVDLVY